MNGKRLLSYILALVLFTAAPALGQIIPRGGGGGGGGGGGDASAANQTTQIGALPLEDAAHVTGDRGSFSLGVENADLALFTAGDKDYTPFAVTARGQPITVPMLSTEIADTNQLGKQDSSAHINTDVGVPSMSLANEGQTQLSTSDNQYQMSSADREGNQSVILLNSLAPYAQGRQVSHLEDVGHVTGDAGIPNWGVNNESLFTFGGAVTDYLPHGVDRFGASLSVLVHNSAGVLLESAQVSKQEDDAHSSGDAGIPAWAVRNSTPTPTATTAIHLDYSPIGVSNLTQTLTVLHHNSAYLGTINATKQEDVGHATTDAGIPSWGVSNTGFSTLAGNLDYIGKAHSTDGAYLSNPVLSTIIGDARATIKNEDTASGGGMAGTATLGIRNQDRAQLAGTELDYIQFATNRFGETKKAPSGDEFFAITDAGIAAVSQNFSFGFTSKKVFISAPATNGAGVCIDHIGGTAVCPASDTAGDDVLEPGESLSFDDHAVSSVSAISVSGTNTIVVRAFN